MNQKKISIIPILMILILPAPVAISIIMQYGGLCISSESTSFLLNYWDYSRSLCSLIFDYSLLKGLRMGLLKGMRKMVFWGVGRNC